MELGIGDDAAVLAAGSEPWVCSVDASVQGVHFDLGFIGLEDVGYRSFQAAVSDLAAMGARPVAALSALILPRSLSSADIDRLTAGQTSPCLSAYWKASIKRKASSTLRPTGKSLTVAWRTMPFGSMMNEPRNATPPGNKTS